MALSLNGVIPAAVTPFNSDLSINFSDLSRLVETFILDGAIAVNCVAHAGEVIKLSHTERQQVIETVVSAANGRIPVIAGVAAEYDKEAIELAHMAKVAGADAIMVLPPWHIFGSLAGVMGAGGSLDPSGEHTFKYHRAITDSVDIPIVLFNYGPASVCGYSIEALEKLCRLDNVVAIKYISSNIYQFQEAYKTIKSIRGDISVLSADDLTLYYAFVHGVDGALIGIANVATKLWVEMFELMKGGNYKLARDIHEQLTPFAIATHDPIMYHVVRIKIALHEMGQISSSSVRQPPFPGEEDRHIVRKSLEAAHLLPRKMLA